jgi:hypothetical protein
VEVHISSDVEFFDILQKGLSSFAALQSAEQQRLIYSITQLGDTIVKLTDPSSKEGRHDLAAWQQVFELYRNSRVFFSTNEQDHGTHSAKMAQAQFMHFLEMAQKQSFLTKFKTEDSYVALRQFVQINIELLQNLKFQDINQIAIGKILKSRLRFFNDLGRLAEIITFRVRQAHRLQNQIDIHGHHPSINSNPRPRQIPFRRDFE